MNRRRSFLYGMDFPNPDPDRLIERHERHNAEVRDYFKDRPGDLLEVDWTRGAGWQQLAPFLGSPVLTIPFFHAKKGRYRGWLYRDGARLGAPSRAHTLVACKVHLLPGVGIRRAPSPQTLLFAPRSILCPHSPGISNA